MTDLSHLLHDLEAAITEDVTRALAEDVRGGDLTASWFRKNAGHARVISREAGVVAGASGSSVVYGARP